MRRLCHMDRVSVKLRGWKHVHEMIMTVHVKYPIPIIHSDPSNDRTFDLTKERSIICCPSRCPVDKGLFLLRGKRSLQLRL